MRIHHHKSGLYFAASSYSEKNQLKTAGFRWHGNSCSETCKACEARLGRVWWTDDPTRSLRFVQYASDEETRQRIEMDVARKERENANHAKKAEAVYRQSRAKDSVLDIPAPDGRRYLPYQRAAVAFAAERDALIADEMGLGKTIEAIGVLNLTRARSVLIVCPASLKINWTRELAAWLAVERSCSIAVDEFPGSDIVVTNYAQLGKWEQCLSARTWDLLILDECHYAKNARSLRSKRALAIKAKRRVFLTGTPILNRPFEIQPLVSALCPTDEEFADFWFFVGKYCNARLVPGRGWDFTGASNLAELERRLRSTVMIRRLKEDVLEEIPEKRRQVITVCGLEKAIEREVAFVRDLLRSLQELKEATEKATSPKEYEAAMLNLREGRRVAFREISKMRHKTALAKVPEVIRHVEDVLQCTDKLVLFAHHHDVVDKIVQGVKAQSVVLTGRESAKAKQSAVDRFQNDPSCSLFIGSIGAAGNGLTLTASSHVVFAELDWTPANMTQAEDRCHRIGQRKSVLVQHLVMQFSIDAKLAHLLLAKQRVIDNALDQEKTTNSSAVLQASLLDALDPEGSDITQPEQLFESLPTVQNGNGS